jgi:hypothetical protein
MTGFFGEPTKLFMKPEKPDFLRIIDCLKSFVFTVPSDPFPWRSFSVTASMLLKLMDDLSDRCFSEPVLLGEVGM